MEEHSRRMALLSAFGWAVGYLLVGKLLAAVLPPPAAGTALLLKVCVAAPLVEELVFRGAVQRCLHPLGQRQAVVLQAVLFAAQHGSLAEVLYALACGLVLGALAEHTGHLWPGMLLHSLNNLLVFAAG